MIENRILNNLSLGVLPSIKCYLNILNYVQNLLLRTSPRFLCPIGTKPLQKCSLAREYE